MSTDGGAVWEQKDSYYNDGGACIVHPDSSNLIITGGDEYPTTTLRRMIISWSSDAGDSWNRVFVSDTGPASVYSITVAPSNHSLLYAGGHVNYAGAVRRSTDYGRTWTETGAPTGRVWGLIVHPTDENTVYAAALDSCWKTTDGGATWERLGGGYYLNDVCLFPGSPDTVIVAGRYGVAMSDDAGDSWEPLNEGLGVANVTSLKAVDDNGTVKLFAGTAGGGVYVYSFSTGINEWQPVSMPAGSRVTPNPVTRGGLVRLAVPRACAEPVVLFDRSGREAAHLTRVGPAERCQYRLPADIRSGVYFVSVPGREDVAPAKLVVR